jgi:methylenetetrahydrofolate--tRNA-(uracil-5-)-methyltransferase
MKQKGIFMADLKIIGGGLSGSEAAWQAANRGMSIELYEMRPLMETGAHVSPLLGELVCSNSLGSELPDRAPGLLKQELRKLNSLLIECADATKVPAGGALAVDRERFAKLVTQRIENHPNIKIIRQEYRSIPKTPAVIATGPLTSSSLSGEIAQLTGKDHLFFFDAISPIVTSESVNMKTAFRASRYQRGDSDEGDYLNCPFTKEEYDAFVIALANAERIELKSFELGLEKGVKAGAHKYFEGCLPVEIIARRGHKALAFGPMRPVGLQDPRSTRRPYAVVQLRQDNLAGSLYNLVGFQTNLTFKEQKRVFRMIPGLETAEFVRFGQMHRNTFLNAPDLLRPTLQFHSRDDLFFAGQITGVEGYAGNIGTGLLAGLNASKIVMGKEPVILPPTTMLGALCHYITNASPADFQPMKANFGILPPIGNRVGRVGKRERAAIRVSRASKHLDDILHTITRNDH